jgi:hypothetical protein
VLEKNIGDAPDGRFSLHKLIRMSLLIQILAEIYQFERYKTALLTLNKFYREL